MLQRSVIVLILYALNLNSIATNFNLKLENKHLQKLATTAVIGSGPAGQASALHLSRLGGKVFVFAGEDHGQLDYSSDVENILYVQEKSGKEINELGIAQIKSLGTLILNEKVEKINFSVFPFEIITNKKNIYYAFSIVLAMGASPKKLDIPGFEKYWGRGVSSCAKCDGSFYKEKNVVVIGGGDSACEEAVQLSYHAKKIYILVRSNKMRASNAMQEKIKKLKNVEILYNTQATKISGDEKHIKEVVLKTKTGEKPLAVDGVFIAIGASPNTEFVKNFLVVNKNGYVVCKGRSQESSLNGVFAAGDICDPRYKQASTAVGEGVKAAIDAFDFLENSGVNREYLIRHEEFFIKQYNINKNFVKKNQDPSAPLNKKSKIYKLHSEKEFYEIIKKEEYVVLDFFASWCPPCQKMKDTINLYMDSLNSVSVIMIDVDQFSGLANKYSISSIPKLFLVKNGSVISDISGYLDLNSFTKWVYDGRRK